MPSWRRRPPDFSGRLGVGASASNYLGRRIGRAGAGTHGLVFVASTVDSPCALLVDIAASDRGSAETAAIDALSAHVSPPTQAAAARPAASAAASAATSSRRPARRRASSSCSLKKELGDAEREDDPQDQEKPESGKTPQARPARSQTSHRPEPDQGLLQGLLRLLARRGLRDLRREYRLDEEVKTVVSYYHILIMHTSSTEPSRDSASRKTRPPESSTRARSRRRGSL